MQNVGTLDEFQPIKDFLSQERENAQKRYKELLENAPRRDKKRLNEALAGDMEYFDYCEKIIDAAIWLTDRFGEGTNRDIPGLCKTATLEEIEAKSWSLTPGAYVGVAPQEDDGVDFAQRMGEIHRELLELQAQSNELMETISKNFKEMGL